MENGWNGGTLGGNCEGGNDGEKVWEQSFL